MKKILFVFLSVLSMNLFAQEDDTYPQDQEKKHELTMNAVTLIASEWLDFSYDYLIDEESSFGVDLQFGLDSSSDFDVYRTFSFTPNYRRFFSNKYARGFYVEGFAMVHTYREDFYDFSSNNYITRKQTDLSLGVSVGGKWVTKKGFVADIFLGVGRNLLNADDSLNEIAGRVGISVGYRF